MCVWSVSTRERFGEEMIGIYDEHAGGRKRVALFLDVLGSIFRQWVLRPAYREPALSTAPAEKSSDTPIFHMFESSLPRRSALVNGAVLSLVIFSALTFTIGRGAIDRTGSLPPLLVRARPARPQMLGVDGSSVWLDMNHDGKLSPEECGFVGESPTTKRDPQFVQRARLEFMRLNPVLAALDADHDGEISTDEIRNSSAALRTLDKNRDGSLTPDEVLPDSLTKAPPPIAILPYWKTLSFNGSRPMATSRSFHSSSWASSDFRCPMSSC